LRSARVLRFERRGLDVCHGSADRNSGDEKTDASRQSHAKLNDGMNDFLPVFLRYAGKTPCLAGCAKCHLKFFTPGELMKDPEAATKYLRERFAQHTCKWVNSEETSADIPCARGLRIVTPSLGICAACNMRFLASSYLRDHAKQAEFDVRRQFQRHACKHSARR
jgi:hypothetical protein